MDSIIDQLEAELSHITIPTRLRKNVSQDRIRSITFGQVYQPFHEQTPQPSVFNSKMPRIWELLQELGKLLPIPWNAVQLNHNVVCGPHIDKNNQGNSVIISFGNYTGNDLVINGQIFNTKRNPLLFDGKNVHYNTPQVSGNKYSLVYFTV